MFVNQQTAFPSEATRSERLLVTIALQEMIGFRAVTTLSYAFGRPMPKQVSLLVPDATSSGASALQRRRWPWIDSQKAGLGICRPSGCLIVTPVVLRSLLDLDILERRELNIYRQVSWALHRGGAGLVAPGVRLSYPGTRSPGCPKAFGPCVASGV